jgi:uncharacterized protein
MGKITKNKQPRIYFDCSNCHAYCCSIYERVSVSKRDLNRLAKYFGVTVETAKKRYTKMHGNERVLRQKRDVIFEKSCQFLDPVSRGCTIYEGRPGTCREYPGQSRCSYYDVLQFEREQQGDPDVVPLVQITFRDSSV